jgi:hypothetical protein
MKDVKRENKLAASEIVVKDADSGKLESLPLAASHEGKEEPNKTGELSSQVVKTGNPFEILSTYNPADQKTEILVEVNQMIGASFKDYFRQAAPWILELKNKRFQVRPGSKGKQLRIGGKDVYWHEFYVANFTVTKRHFQQLEKQVKQGTWENPNLKEGDKVTFQSQGHAFDGAVVKLHESADKVDVQKGNDAAKVITVPVGNVSKIKEPRIVKLTSLGELVVCMDVDGGSEYEYAGSGKLVRTKTLSLNKQKAQRNADRTKAIAETERLKKKQQEEDEQRKRAELAKRALDAIADEERMLADKKKMIKSGNIPAGLIGKTTKRRKSKATAPAAVTSVKVAKLENEDGYALFEEAAFAPFTLNKATSGKYATRAECEAARESVNAKRAKRAAAPAATVA